MSVVIEGCGLSAGVRAWVENGGKALSPITGGMVDYTPVTLEITGKNNFQVRVSWKAFYTGKNSRDDRRRQAEAEIGFVRTICATGKVKRIELSTSPAFSTFEAPDYALPSKVLEILDYPPLSQELYVRPEDRAYFSRLVHQGLWAGIVAYMIAVHFLRMGRDQAYNYAVAAAQSGQVSFPIGGDTGVIISPPRPQPPPGGAPTASLHIDINGYRFSVPAVLNTDGSYVAENVNLPVVGLSTIVFSLPLCSLVLDLKSLFTRITKSGQKVSDTSCRFVIDHGGKSYNVTISLGQTVSGGPGGPPSQAPSQALVIAVIAMVAILGIILIGR